MDTQHFRVFPQALLVLEVLGKETLQVSGEEIGTPQKMVYTPEGRFWFAPQRLIWVTNEPSIAYEYQSQRLSFTPG